MMTNFYLFASAMALAGLAVPVAAQPRSAAFETSADPSVSRPFMFTGATVRVPSGSGSRGPAYGVLSNLGFKAIQLSAFSHFE